MTQVIDNFGGILEGFEGPEKRLEVIFKQNPNDIMGLRAINKEQWQDMLDLVRCLIVGTMSTSVCDSYVLSESSLFVYPYKVVIKTCGTTTLLRCLDKLKEYAADKGTEVDYAMFSRKNYNFPHRQKVPHCSFDMELKTLRNTFGEAGEDYVLGPRVSGVDEEFVYIYGKPELNNNAGFYYNAPSFEMMMSELDSKAMKNFYRSDEYVDAKTTTRTVGLADIIPDLVTDEVMFDPCGYSINGLSTTEGSYFTVHVTPEDHCSFVSFETNSAVAFEGNKLATRVAEIFCPGKFTMVCCFSSPKQMPAEIPKVEGFSTLYEFVGEVEGGMHMIACHFKKE